MNVLHVNDIASVGYTLVKELVSRGINAKLLLINNKSSILRSNNSKENFVIKVNNNIRKLLSILSYKWDLLHVHYLRTYAYIASIIKSPYTVHIHGSDIRLAYDKGIYEGLIHRMLKKFSLARSKMAFVSTPNLVALTKLLSPRTNVVYLPNPVDITHFTPERSRRLSKYFAYLHDGVDLLITMPSRIHFSNKGNDVLVKALTSVKTNTSYRLVVVKYGPDLYKLLKLINMLGLRKKTVLIDPIPNELMPGLYGISDIVVGAITKREVFGMTALESMACGTTVVNTWSRKYYVNAKFPVLHYSIENIRRFLEMLMEDPILRSNIASMQLRWVKENHDSKIVVMKLIHIYQDIL